MFKNLEKELNSNGFDVETLASVIGGNFQTVADKFNGQIPFTLGEVKLIRDEMFPEKTLDYLFEEERND